MDIQTDKIVGLLIILLLTCGCSNQNIGYMENSYELDLKRKVSIEQKHECWNEFNGNGYKLIQYKIKANYLEQITENAMLLEFEDFDMSKGKNPFNGLKVDTLLRCRKGFYKSIWKDDEISIVAIDPTAEILVFYFAII